MLRRRNMGIILNTTYTFFGYTGIFFGSPGQLKSILREPGQFFADLSWRHLKPAAILTAHLLLLYKSLYQLFYIGLNGFSLASVRPANIANSTEVEIDDFMDNDDFKSSLKPITRIVFNVYTFTFFFDKVRFYITCLVRGHDLVLLLSHPLYRAVDNNRKCSRLLIAALGAYNLFMCTFNLVIENKAASLWGILDELVEVIQMNNHYQLIYMMNFYILISTEQHLRRMTSFIKQEHISCREILQLKDTLSELVANLDKFYSLSSMWLMSKLIFSVVSLVFTTLYTLLSYKQNGFYRMIIMYMLFVLLLDLLLYYLCTRLVSTFNHFYRATAERILATPPDEHLPDYWNDTCKWTVVPRAPESIQIELYQFDHYRCRLWPRIFHITHLHLAVFIRMVAFGVNFAIILVQTEEVRR